MRKITCVAVKYDDGTVEVYRGKGNAHQTRTHNAPSRDAPSAATPMIHFLRLHLQIESQELGFTDVIVK